MDEERLQPNSDFLPNQSGERVDNGGDDRISELPNEVLVKILSYLPVRSAASTTVLSSRWLDLWKHIPNLESDRISQLPDLIISIILSFLPLKIAAATCVLSSRWLNSWKHTPNLNFDCDIVPISSRGNTRAEVCKYMEMVNSILQSHKALSLKQFRICFYVDESARWAVTKWLEFVFLRKVESLELNFQCSDWHEVVLGESLREIRTMYGDPRSLIFFQSLKSLHLATLKVSGEDIELFLHNCPLLELLMIHFVSLTSDIEVCSPSLKHLDLTRSRGGKSIKVSAPKLTFIRFCNEEGELLFENVPILAEANFEINTSEFVMHHFASAASSHISQLQFLNIRLPHPKVFWTNTFPRMPNLKKLAIKSFQVYNHSLLPVTRVIWASPRLEEFTLQFCGFGGDRRLPEKATAYMQEIADVGRSPHQHLKVFNLHFPYGQTMNNHAIDLVTYVWNNCVALRRIDIVCVRMPDYLKRFLQSELPNHVQLTIKEDLMVRPPIIY